MSFLSSPVWDGVSGIVTLLTALVPVVTFLSRWLMNTRKTTEATIPGPRQPPSGSVLSTVTALQTSSSLPGCSRVGLAVTLNTAVLFAHLFVSTWFLLGLLMRSREAGITASVFPRTWENAGQNMLAGCVGAPFFLLFLLLLAAGSTFVSVRKGYAAGTYVTVLGSSSLYILNALYIATFYGNPLPLSPQLLASGLVTVFLAAVIWFTQLAIKHTQATA